MRSLLLVSVLALGLVAAARPAAAGDVRMYVHHEVNDYAAWRKVYNDFDPTRRKMGVTAQAVYRSIDNPNDVTVTHDFRSAEKAKAFAASAELKAAMEKAGLEALDKEQRDLLLRAGAVERRRLRPLRVRRPAGGAGDGRSRSDPHCQSAAGRRRHGPRQRLQPRA